MKVEVTDLEKRMSRIEDKLDLIVDNHLKHLNIYTKIGLFLITVSVIVSLSAIGISLGYLDGIKEII